LIGARPGDPPDAGFALPHIVVAVNQPIQHFAASFRCASRSTRVRVSVLYWASNSDGQYDPEFGRHVNWDVDLLSDYRWLQAKGADPISRTASFVASLRALKPDVVVCFGWASAAARLAIPWCLLTRTPLFFYGDTSWQNSSTGPRQWLRRLLLRYAFHFAEGALSSGAFNREFYIHLGMHPERIVDSVYPIDVASYAAARDPGQARQDKRVIGFAGKLISRKGVDELLRALQLLAHDGTWAARIIGDGDEREGLQELCDSLGIGARVDFRGFRNTSEMPAELAACDIVVVPSRQDNRGMIAAEAMAAGAAVVVSSKTGVWGRGDLVEDGVTGRVYRSGDPTELAAIMGYLLRTPDALESLQRQGARRAAEHGPDAFTAALERAALTVGAHG